MSNPPDPRDPLTAAEPGEAMPPIDFTTFVLSLSTSVLMHLGLVDGPDGSRAEPSPQLARQTIDLIALLQEKTRGNLTGAEEQLLDQVLFDLRMRYVEVAGHPAR
jgi:hypothetical protein